MTVRPDFVAYRCICGFRLDHVPRNVIDELPRCLGCGRALRAPAPRLRSRALVDVRDLR